MGLAIIWRGYIIGIVILGVAIILNTLALKFGILTWYSFIGEIGKGGIIQAVKYAGVLSLFFLFILYPLVLGLCGYIATQKLF
jgi:hypothetical protein